MLQPFLLYKVSWLPGLITRIPLVLQVTEVPLLL